MCPQWCSIHHCGHTFLCSLRWPHGWMLHHCGHLRLQRKVCPQWCSSTHEVISDYRERWPHGGCYTIVDTPFSIVWDVSTWCSYTIVDISEYRERCVHNGVAPPMRSSQSLRWPHGWMLHHCGHTFLWLRDDPHGGCYTIVDHLSL